MIDTILFDLDGTLLPMNQDYFLMGYFQKIMSAFSDLNMEIFLPALKQGIKAMIENDGTMTNEQRFWQTFNQLHPHDDTLEGRFLKFYENDFQALIEYTNPNPIARQVIHSLKLKGYHLLCCTNPLFPQIATFSRIKWAGLNPNDFEVITTYENSSYCKPNILYYQEVIKQNQLQPETCLMVGNDVAEDMIVKNLGMKTFLLLDNIINVHNLSYTVDYQGSFNDLLSLVSKLPER
jgi:FMN phosphatase YigB (HAD superfamily)